MDNTLQKLEWRLRSIANSSRKSDDGQCALLIITVFKTGNQILGWTKPEVQLIEPRLFNYSKLDIQPIVEWESVTAALSGKMTILIQRGEPVGIIENQKEAG